MNLEHRWGQRRKLDTEVILDARPRGTGRARVRDASTSGLFVETALALPIHSRVRVVFVTHTPSVARIHRLEAIVVRQAPAGLGLMFTEFDPQAWAALVARGAERRTTPLAPVAQAFARHPPPLLLPPPAAGGGGPGSQAQTSRRIGE